MQVGSDMLSRKIQDNYQLMGKSINATDLLHMVTTPPEVYVGQEVNQYMLINEQNNITNKQHFEMMNSFLNRMMLFGTENFTFQDEVYVTSVLQKLGITDVNEFMTEMKQELNEHHHLKKLVQKYEKNETQIQKFLQNMQNITKKQTTDIINQEKHDTVRFFMQNNIYDRMQTKEWNRFMYEKKKYSFMNHSEITSQELSFSEQLLLADTIELRQIKQKLLLDQQPAEYNQFHFYEQIPIPEEQITEQTVLRYLGAAILTNLVKNLNYIRTKSGREKEQNWTEYTTAFYGNSNDTIERFEDAHMQTHKHLYQQNHPFYSMNKLYESELNILTMLENNQEEIKEEIYPSVQMINALLQIQNKEKQAYEYIYTGSQIRTKKEIEDYYLIENLKAEEQLLKNYQYQITKESHQSSYPFIEKILEQMGIAEKTKEERLKAVTEVLQQLPLQMVSGDVLIDLSEQILKKEYEKRIEETHYHEPDSMITEIAVLLKNITGNDIIKDYLTEAVSISEENFTRVETVYAESEETGEQSEEEWQETRQANALIRPFVEEIVEQIEKGRQGEESKQAVKEILQQLPPQMQSREVLVLFAEQILREEYQSKIKTEREYQKSSLVTEIANRLETITGNEVLEHFLEKAMQLQNENVFKKETQITEPQRLQYRMDYQKEVSEMPYLSEVIREMIQTEQYTLSQTDQIKERKVPQINVTEEISWEQVDFSTLSLKEQKVYLDKINERNMLRKQILEQNQAKAKKEQTILVDRKAAMKKTLAALENPEQAVLEVLTQGEAIQVENQQTERALELLDAPLRKFYEKILNRRSQTVSEEENRKEILKFEHILTEIEEQEAFRESIEEVKRTLPLAMPPRQEAEERLLKENTENIIRQKEIWKQAEETVDQIRESGNVIFNEREKSAATQAKMQFRNDGDVILKEEERLLQIQEDQKEQLLRQVEKEILQEQKENLELKKDIEKNISKETIIKNLISPESQYLTIQGENRQTQQILHKDHSEILLEHDYKYAESENAEAPLQVSKETIENIIKQKEIWKQTEETVEQIRESGNVVFNKQEKLAVPQVEMQFRNDGDVILKEEERLLQIQEEQKEHILQEVQKEILKDHREHILQEIQKEILQDQKENSEIKKEIDENVSKETIIKNLLSPESQYLTIQGENRQIQQILHEDHSEILLEHDYRYATPENMETPLQDLKETTENITKQKEIWKQTEQTIDQIRESGNVIFSEQEKSAVPQVKMQFRNDGDVILQEEEQVLQIQEDKKEQIFRQVQKEILQDQKENLELKKEIEEIVSKETIIKNLLSPESQYLTIQGENRQIQQILHEDHSEILLEHDYRYATPENMETPLQDLKETTENITKQKEIWKQTEQTIDQIRESGNVIFSEQEKSAVPQVKMQFRNDGDVILQEEEQVLQIQEDKKEQIFRQVQKEILQDQKENLELKKEIEEIVSKETIIKNLLSPESQYLTIQGENRQIQQILHEDHSEILLEHDYRYQRPEEAESGIQILKERYEKEMLQKEVWKEIEQRIENVREIGAVTIKEIEETVITPMEMELQTIHTTVPAVFETVEELQQVQTRNYLQQNAKMYVTEEGVQFVHKQREQHLEQEEIEELLAESKTVLSKKEVKTELVNYSTTLEQRLEETKEEIIRQSRKSVTELIQNNLINQMNTISDQVYQKLEHKLLNERKRRGY